MLVLSRGLNQTIVIDGGIFVEVLEIQPNKVRLGIVCDKSIPVHRKEVFESVGNNLLHKPILDKEVE